MKISVETDIQQAIAKLQSITEQQQFKFAVAKALTKTASDVQQEVRKNMPSRFVLRKQWIVQGIRVTAATKNNLEAIVASRDRFMDIQEAGGDKSPLRKYLAIPTSLVRRTKTGLISASSRPAALGSKVGVVEYQGNKYLALKKGIYSERTSSESARGGMLRLRFMYLLVPKAKIKERLGLGKDGIRVVRAKFAQNLQDALDQAVKTAR